jgi:hypothetical protein
MGKAVWALFLEERDKSVYHGAHLSYGHMSKSKVVFSFEPSTTHKTPRRIGTPNPHCELMVLS